MSYSLLYVHDETLRLDFVKLLKQLKHNQKKQETSIKKQCRKGTRRNKTTGECEATKKNFKQNRKYTNYQKKK